MNFSLKPHPLVAHWVPGMTFLVLVWGSRHGWNFREMAAGNSNNIWYMLIFSVGAFVIGQVFDAFRDTLIERFLDKGKTLDWEKIINAEATKADRFEDYYFTYYVLDWNLALSLIASLLFTSCAINCICTRLCMCLVILVLAALFISNAISLRKEMIKIVEGWPLKKEDNEKTA